MRSTVTYKFQLRRTGYTTNGICQLFDLNVPLVLNSITGAELL